ncbi:hypothetical protein BWR15_06155 [Pseudomonas sp. T]|nr:hypothetical protein BWR15_06155 [Pseudomonas sp. T]
MYKSLKELLSSQGVKDGMVLGVLGTIGVGILSGLKILWDSANTSAPTWLAMLSTPVEVPIWLAGSILLAGTLLFTWFAIPFVWRTVKAHQAKRAERLANQKKAEHEAIVQELLKRQQEAEKQKAPAPIPKKVAVRSEAAELNARLNEATRRSAQALAAVNARDLAGPMKPRVTEEQLLAVYRVIASRQGGATVEDISQQLPFSDGHLKAAIDEGVRRGALEQAWSRIRHEHAYLVTPIGRNAMTTAKY